MWLTPWEAASGKFALHSIADSELLSEESAGVRAVDAVELKPVVDDCCTLEQLPQALAHLKRGAFGKIVVKLS